MANLFIKNKIKQKDFDIYILILIGLYQINFLRIPNHAAVFETAKAAEQINKAWAKNFINAVLRNYLRNEKKVEEKIKSMPSAMYLHPDWLLKKFQKSWPDYWLDIIHENNQRPPMILRVNLLKLSRNNYLQKLEKESIKAAEPRFSTSFISSAVILDSPCDVKNLPGYLEGEISVQDCAAQLAAELLLLLPGQRVLDACAAPGGKTTHILEKEQFLSELIAIDNKSARLDKVKENLKRLGLNAKLILADAASPKTWWDGKDFDRILLDAPCSATGVIRRHPDIKIIRQPEDIDAKKSQQLDLLNALWPLLKPGGILLYASCSIFPEENTQLLEFFLQKNTDACEEIIHADWGIAQPVGRQILPSYEMDGFFYARLKKC
jgi:16S rRNA (cytosine967-C5)-methyltransferase